MVSGESQAVDLGYSPTLSHYAGLCVSLICGASFGGSTHEKGCGSNCVFSKELSQTEFLWVGSCHFTPGCTVAQFEEEAEFHFQALRKTATKVVVQGDVNVAFGWIRKAREVFS